MFFVVFFWSAFEQAGASLTFFADEQTNRHLGLLIPKWIILIVYGGLLYYFFTTWKRAVINLKQHDLSLLRGAEIIIIILVAIILYSSFGLINTYKINSYLDLNEIPASAFQSLNSLFVVLFAPLFAWLWLKMGKNDPASPTKMAWGLLLLAIGFLVIAFGVKNVQPGIKVSMLWLISMYLLHTWGELCLSPIGLSLVNKLAPLKYSSMLMAVWFLANAFANKLAGVLSALYPDGKTTSFLGYQMSNLYQFFLLFVILSGVASLILFALTKSLQKLMNTDS